MIRNLSLRNCSFLNLLFKFDARLILIGNSLVYGKHLSVSIHTHTVLYCENLPCTYLDVIQVKLPV
jgi:hypothetical protein